LAEGIGALLNVMADNTRFL
jgi:hypothetical protein